MLSSFVLHLYSVSISFFLTLVEIFTRLIIVSCFCPLPKINLFLMNTNSNIFYVFIICMLWFVFNKDYIIRTRLDQNI